MIGVFDRGVGGLSVWREIARCVPAAPLIYLADQAYVPYGSRSLEEVMALTLRCVRWLIEQRRCSVIVIACNTASGAALDTLRETFPNTPIVGMEPAVKPAALNTQTGVVGVLATQTTFKSQRYADLIRKWAHGVQVIELVCKGWVELVESGESSMGGVLSPHSTLHSPLIAGCVTPLLAQRADTLVLGCTHFPFLLPQITQVIDEWRMRHADAPAVAVIDPAPSVAQQTSRVWQKIYPKSQLGSYEFWTTGHAPSLESSIATLIDISIKTKRITL